MSRRWYRSTYLGVPVHTQRQAPEDSSDRNLAEVLDLGRDGLRRHVAIHEAGHAVVGICQGAEATGAEIGASVGEDGLPLDGACSIQPFNIPWPDLGAICAAGERAAHRWLHEEGLATPRRLWANELSSAADRLTAERLGAGKAVPPVLTYGAPGSVPGGYEWADLGDAADEVLEADWSAVRRVADALYERGRLTGDDLDELL